MKTEQTPKKRRSKAEIEAEKFQKLEAATAEAAKKDKEERAAAAAPKKRVFPKHVSTYDRENHLFECHLRDLLTKYFVPKQANIDGSIEYIREDEWLRLSVNDREHYAPMTQQQLAIIAGLRIGAITEIVKMKRDTINLFQISAVARALGITDLNEIFTLKQE
jgi:putative transcriptional regulator